MLLKDDPLANVLVCKWNEKEIIVKIETIAKLRVAGINMNKNSNRKYSDKMGV